MTKKICVITGTRAEYGLLKPLIERFLQDEFFNLKLVVTGMHLSTEFGLTYKLIEEDNIEIDEKIEILLSSDTPVATSKAMGLAMISFSEYFNRTKPDMVIVLGDRFEILAASMAAMIANIPISHIHGGEITEGAQDDSFRHCITKMSYLHFTSTEEYRKRVIQLGEDPKRVFNVGAIGTENIKKMTLLSKDELENSINQSLSKAYGLVTFHPVTLENGKAEEQIKTLLSALDEFPDMNFIITKANADNEGRKINKIIDDFIKNKPNRYFCFTTLGQVKYLTAMKYCSVVIGNSSSGIIEAPTLKKPVVNIGSRQRGRAQSSSIINCNCIKEEIISAIKKANDEKYIEYINSLKNPYEQQGTVETIYSKIKYFFNENSFNKKFYDI